MWIDGWINLESTPLQDGNYDNNYNMTAVDLFLSLSLKVDRILSPLPFATMVDTNIGRQL